MEYKAFRGIVPACLLPFNKDYSIDEASYRNHLEWLVGIKGVGAITINGHAAEGSSLNKEERLQSIRIAVNQVKGRVPIICGIMQDGTLNAIEEAKAARDEGVDGLLIFPSCEFTSGGGTVHPDMVFKHYEAIAEAVSLPMVAFSYASSSDLNYPVSTFVRLCRDIDNVVSIKDASYDIIFYETLYREIKKLNKDVTMLSSFSKTMLASFAVGADGLLSGNGSIIPEFQVALFEAVNRGDLKKAREIADFIWPMVSACYSSPFTDMHNRMKYVACKLGRIATDTARMPLLPLNELEKKRLDEAIIALGMGKEPCQVE
ncbi:MAG: dihydrodipicolinate synthase family protein [Firmicutes bacterium]|nr:dihydrodipicolinate synthase family protein [Bacillota bacterium]